MDRRTFIMSGCSAALAASPLTALAAPLLPHKRATGLGTWETITPAPTARADVGVGLVGERIYVVGGHSLRGGALNEVYDPVLDIWLERAPLPRELASVGVVGVGDKLYAIGGFAEKEPVADAFEYVASLDRWRAIAPLPAPRGAVGVATFDNKVYAVGGRGATGDAADVYRFTIETNSWERLASLPRKRSALQLVVLEGRLHAVGGQMGSSAHVLHDHDVYDVFHDGWSSAAPSPTARASAAATVLSGRLHIMGGLAGTTASQEDVLFFNEAYDPKSDAWTTLAALPHPRFGTGAVTIGSTIYLPVGATSLGAAGASDIMEKFVL